MCHENYERKHKRLGHQKKAYAFSIPTIMPTKLIKARINTEENKHKNSYLEKEFEFDFHKTS